jgi:hypothetical protein
MITKNILIKDWSTFNNSSKEDRALLIESLGRFLVEPRSNPEVIATLAKIQEFATPQDFPTSVLQVLDKYHLTTDYDIGWQSIFRQINLMGQRRNGFDISEVQSGLTFDKIPIGEKLLVHKMWGEKAHVFFDIYGGALGWHKTLFDDEEYWTIEDNAIEFRNKAYAKQAQVFYALIEAVPAANDIAWQAPDPAALAVTDATYTANRDIMTGNAAALRIIKAVANKGYGITAQNAEFIVLVPEDLRGRAQRALNLQQQAFSGSGNLALYRFRIISTTMLTDLNHAYVILPKIKLQWAERMDLTTFASFDMLSYTEAAAGWMRYGGAIGDTDQIVRCGMAP